MAIDVECAVCFQRKTCTVSSLPGVPITVARCEQCRAADAIPLVVAVATTAEIGGMDQAADWWRECVSDTLIHLKVPETNFLRMVEVERAGYRRLDSDPTPLDER